MRMYIPGRKNFFTKDKTTTFSFRVIETSRSVERLFRRDLECASGSCPNFDNCAQAGQGVNFVPDARRLATMFPNCTQVANIEEEAGEVMKNIPCIIREENIPNFTIDKGAGGNTVIKYNIPNTKSIRLRQNKMGEDDPRWAALVKAISTNISKN
ncbi:MAG: hypothetical protein FWD15_00830 [Alphaproteobacteria bacterium]|nr:hypothetical protein [Alphaproteobacteria bacterium]